MKSSVELVDGIMERHVLTLRADTNVLEAANLLFERGLTGLPVVDDAKKVIGILTEYDLITKGSAIHLPTFLKIMRDTDVYRKDEGSIKGDLKKIMDLTVKDVMNDDPLTVQEGAKIDEVAKIFAEHHRVNPIPVVDDMHRLVGVVSRFDIIKLYAGTHRIRRTGDTGGEATDRDVDNFIRKINRNFVFVRKSRTHLWFLVSAVFLIIGMLITLFFTVRVEPNF